MKKLFLFTCFLKFYFHNNHFEKNALRSLPKEREMKNMFSVHLCDLIQNKDKYLQMKFVFLTILWLHLQSYRHIKLYIILQAYGQLTENNKLKRNNMALLPTAAINRCQIPICSGKIARGIHRETSIHRVYRRAQLSQN